MKNLLHLTLFFLCCNIGNIKSQVVLNEVAFGGFLGDFVELKNLGPGTVDVSGHFLFSAVGSTSSVQLSELNLVCGSLVMEEGDIIVFDNVSDFINWQPNTGEVGLYDTDANDFEFPGDMVDYVAWGTTTLSTITQMVAVFADEWTGGDLVEGNWNGLSLEYDGTGDESSDWPFNNMPTICAENTSAGVECEVVAGMPNIPQFDFCVGDGNDDHPTGLAVTGAEGSFLQWAVTDAAGTILELPASAEEANFENAPEGLCVMWHVAYENGLMGLQPGSSIMMLQGCHALSTPVLISRTQVSGGTLEGGPFDFCVGDAVADFVSGISLSGNIGATSAWVVTDESGNIIGLPNDPTLVNFDEAPAGICLIWNLSYNPGLTGLALGQNAADLTGCYQLSNPVTVNRFGLNSTECGGGNNQYVLIGFEDLKLERATVNSGGLGVTEEDGDLEILDDSEVIVDGTFVKGPYVRVYDGARVSNIEAVVAQPALPDFLDNNLDTGDDQDLDVNENETVILTESVYEDLDVADGATITFSGHEFVYIEEIDFEDNVTVLFDQCTNLIVDKEMSIGKNNNFNPGEQNVFVFVDEDAEIKKGTFFYGGIYTKEKLRIRKADEDDPTTMYGLFIGNDVKARDYVQLNAANVIPCQPSITGSNPYALTEEQEEEEHAATLLEDKDLLVYPNPTKNIVYLSVMTKEKQSAAIKIYDVMNRLVYEFVTDEIGGQAIKIDVSDFPVGMYTAQVQFADGSGLSQKLMVGR